VRRVRHRVLELYARGDVVLGDVRVGYSDLGPIVRHVVVAHHREEGARRPRRSVDAVLPGREIRELPRDRVGESGGGCPPVGGGQKEGVFRCNPIDHIVDAVDVDPIAATPVERLPHRSRPGDQPRAVGRRHSGRRPLRAGGAVSAPRSNGTEVARSQLGAEGHERVGHRQLLGRDPVRGARYGGDPHLVDGPHEPGLGRVSTPDKQRVRAVVSAHEGVGVGQSAVEVDPLRGGPAGLVDDRRVVPTSGGQGSAREQVSVAVAQVAGCISPDAVPVARRPRLRDDAFPGRRAGAGVRPERHREGLKEAEAEVQCVGHADVVGVAVEADGISEGPGLRVVRGAEGAAVMAVARRILDGTDSAGGLSQVPDAPVGRVPDSCLVLPVADGPVVEVHPDEVGARRPADSGDSDPDVRGAQLVPLLDLVIEDGRVVRVHEAEVFAEVLCACVVDPRAVEPDQDREVVQVLGLPGVVEGDLSAPTPVCVPPHGVAASAQRLVRLQRKLMRHPVVGRREGCTRCSCSSRRCPGTNVARLSRA